MKEDIAKGKGLNIEELITEMEEIVISVTTSILIILYLI